jgi:putative hemolysin
MNSTMNLLMWGVFGLCLVLSFVLSGMEAGVFALSRLRIRQQARAGRRSAQVLHHYLENTEDFLWTILVGNTVANFIVLGWLVVKLHDALGGSRPWFIVVFSLVVFLSFDLFDLLPKTLFRLYPNRLCLRLAHPFRVVHLLLRPLVALVEWCSSLLLRWRGGNVFTGHLFGNRQELRLVMQESAQGLSSEERTMINRVLDLQTLSVRQVMKPLAQAVTAPAQLPVGGALKLAQEHKLTRLPIWDTRDGHPRVVGLVSLNTLLYQPEVDTARPIGDFVKPALYLDEDMRLEIALRRMQRGGHRLALVLSRERQDVGIITLQDVLKVIFGEVSL